ncbi:MAG TPA: hypothetical protein VGP26_27830 [Actinophytocola sp.]|jgi:hypothetical protein|nr:hypothetical protein [Actinophytocola sp.]
MRRVIRGTEQRKAVYFCNPGRRGCGKVYIDVRATDLRLRALTASRLSDPKHAAAVAAARAQFADELARVHEEIRQCEQIQRALADRLGRREIDLDAFDLANEPLVTDLARLRARREELTTNDADGGADGPVRVQDATEIARQWDGGEIGEKRGLFMSALSSSVVYVAPFQRKGKRVFDPDRIRVGDPR